MLKSDLFTFKYKYSKHQLSSQPYTYIYLGNLPVKFL